MLFVIVEALVGEVGLTALQLLRIHTSYNASRFDVVDEMKMQAIEIMKQTHKQSIVVDEAGVHKGFWK